MTETNLIKLSNDIAYDKAYKHLKDNGSPGLNLGFVCLNEYYTHRNSGVTDWTGSPGSGKTLFALECLFNLSEHFGKRHGLYVPDIGSDEDVLEQLVKMKTGKDFYDKYNNKITEKELANALNWIGHHFIIFKKKNFRTGVVPLDFWETVANYKDDGGVLDTGLIDSWKNMKHLYSGREDLYLDDILAVRNELSETSKKHFHTIAHAGKLENDPTTDKRRIPTAHDIKGGGSWHASGKNIITVDYPDKTSNGVDIYVSKVKPRSVGKVGSVIGKLFYDFKKGRYYEVDAPLNYYAYELEKGMSVVQTEAF